MALSRKDCDEIRSVLTSKATNYTYSDVARWLKRGNFEPPQKPQGSHRVWVHPRSNRRVQLVDHGRGELLPAYVKNAARIILEVGECP